MNFTAPKLCRIILQRSVAVINHVNNNNLIRYNMQVDAALRFNVLSCNHYSNDSKSRSGFGSKVQDDESEELDFDDIESNANSHMKRRNTNDKTKKLFAFAHNVDDDSSVAPRITKPVRAKQPTHIEERSVIPRRDFKYSNSSRSERHSPPEEKSQFSFRGKAEPDDDNEPVDYDAYDEYLQRKDQNRRQLPVRNQRHPVRNQQLPVRKHQLPVRNQQQPVRSGQLPVRNHGLSGKGKRETSSRDNRSPSQIPENVPNIKEEIIFGLFPVLLALQERRRTCYNLYIKPDLENSSKETIVNILKLASVHSVNVKPCPLEILDTLSGHRPHQGVCLDASKLSYYPLDEDQLSSYTSGSEHQSPQLWLLLIAIKDPMNFGAILRSSYYLGVDKLLSVKKNSCALSPVVSKASAGVLEVQPVYSVKNTLTFLDRMKSLGWQIVGSTGSVGRKDEQSVPVVPVQQMSLDKNTLLLIGNEAIGLTTNLMDKCHHLVTIQPAANLHSQIDSLNVSVATAILIHDLQSSRSKQE